MKAISGTTAMVRGVVRNAITRDGVLVCTKGGFLPFDGARPADVDRYIDERFVRTGLLRAEEIVDGCHSLAPAFLADSPPSIFRRDSRRRRNAAFFSPGPSGRGTRTSCGIGGTTGLRTPAGRWSTPPSF